MFWRVFIDWNNNGNFSDACEIFFNTDPFLYGFTAPTNNLNSSIAVPAGAVLDTDLSMRIFQDILKIPDVKGVKSITISDISGRLVKSMKASTELHLADLRAGLYIVTLHMNDGTVKAVKAIKK